MRLEITKQKSYILLFFVNKSNIFSNFTVLELDNDVWRKRKVLTFQGRALLGPPKFLQTVHCRTSVGCKEENTVIIREAILRKKRISYGILP